LHPPLLRQEAGAFARSPNRLVERLIQADFELIGPHLRSLEVERDQVLAVAGEDMKYAYFPHSGIISLVVRLPHGETTEIAMVGNLSVSGASAALGSPAALTTAIVQLGGMCSVLPIKWLLEAADQSKTLRTTLILHEQAIFVQTQQAAACNVSHPTIARLARWLLRVRDASGSDELQFTQESLG
jgi:CRP-like cAMP-binding protein